MPGVDDAAWENGMATLEARQVDSRDIAVSFEQSDIVFANNDPGMVWPDEYPL